MKTILTETRASARCWAQEACQWPVAEDSDHHHMEWSVNLTRHEIANLSHVGAQHLHIATRRERTVPRHGGTKKAEGETSEGDVTGGGRRAFASTRGEDAPGWSTRENFWEICYLLYRNKEIRPSNKRVLRSQFNGDLPETVQRRLRGTSNVFREHEI